jgi:uncharacterized protein YbbC (DUF1343 family)
MLKICFFCPAYKRALIFVLLVFSPMLVGQGSFYFAGAERFLSDTAAYSQSRFALVANQTSILHNGTHLVDSLISLGLPPRFIFSPEHGFRRFLPAGMQVNDEVYRGIPVVSLYGRRKTPPDSILRQLDLVVYDVQDLGLRFYTYISTLRNVANACASNQIPLWLLDRPNPLGGHFVAGPVLTAPWESFVGAWPIPLRYGLTPGELLRMGAGEKWLPDSLVWRVFPIRNYSRNESLAAYANPWSPPSPNIPNLRTAYAYAGNCLFEGTVISEGRGTPTPFLLFGYPDSSLLVVAELAADSLLQAVHFRPHSLPSARAPKHLGQLCAGFSLRRVPEKEMLWRTLHWISLIYHSGIVDKGAFFRRSGERYFIDLLLGSDTFRMALEAERDWRYLMAEWERENRDFMSRARPYYLYASDSSKTPR